MEVLLLGIYSFFVWLIFIKFKWLPWNTTSQITVAIIPIVAMTVLILVLNVVAPSSADVRVFKYTIPIVSQVRGRVIEVPVEEGNRLVRKGDVLFRVDPTPYQLTVNSLKAQLVGAEGGSQQLKEQLKSAVGSTAALRARIDLARKRVIQNQELATTGAGNKFDLEQAVSNQQDLEGQLSTAIANEAQVRAQLAAVVDGDIASIAKIKADLANAQWELEQTSVVSPCDCYVINLSLRPGAFVAGIPFNPVMTLVEAAGQVVALYHQNELHEVEPGNYAEFSLNTMPGTIIRAKVDSVIWAQGMGQMPQSGTLPMTGVLAAPPNRFAVKFDVDEKDKALLLAAGAAGHAAIYTEHGKMIHILRMVILRVGAYTDYLILSCIDAMNAHHAMLGFVALTALVACAVRPPPKQADVQAEALPGVQVPGQWKAGGAGPEAVAGSWLATFADARLDALVAEAIAHNPDLKVAEAQVRIAAEYAELADSKLWPQVNLFARGGGKMSGDSSGIAGVALFADWELDVWGRVRSARSASTASYESAVADAEYARQSIAALVAKTYFLATEAGLQLQLAGELITASQELVAFAEQRQKVGNGDGYDAAIARANVETFRDAEEQLKLAREQALRGLEALLGRYPAAEIEAATELAKAPGPVPAGLPSELLERRPDVVAAERRVASAFYGTQEAKAARLPAIKLTGSVNHISSDLFVLKNRADPVWSAGASLLQPIFNAGALQTQVRIRTEQQKLALADYGRIGARAFGEVEGALSAEFAAGQREAVLTRAVADNQQALDFANVRYKVGSGDLRGVRQQQLAVYGSRSALIRVQADKLVQRVNLYLALGGGFDAAPAPVAQAKE